MLKSNKNKIFRINLLLPNLNQFKLIENRYKTILYLMSVNKCINKIKKLLFFISFIYRYMSNYL